MDETNGFTAYDSTKNAHDAALINFTGRAQWVTGETNGALNFNATTNNQRATISDSDGRLNFGTNPGTAFSVAVWVKAKSGVQPSGAGIIAKGFGHGGEKFAMDIQGSYRFFVRSSADVATQVGPTGTVDGSWHHLVGVYDGVYTTGGLKLYIDGQLAGTNNAPITLFNTNHDISLGSREDTSTSGYTLPLYGTLDDVRIYNRALSAADVQELYTATWIPSAAISAAEFDAVRLKWRDMLNGGTNLDAANADVMLNLSNLTSSAQSLWSRMNKSAGRTFLWTNLPALTNTSGQIWNTYLNLQTMALAYSTAGSGLYTNSALFSDLSGALDWMYVNIYNEHNTKQYDNWWHWQIGVPLLLNNTTVLLYDNLTGIQITNYMNAVNHFTPIPTGDGANLVWEATVVAVRGAIVKDSSKLNLAVQSLSSVFPLVTSGDGFYADGSFVFHSIYAYSGGYGISLIENLAPVVDMVSASPWAVTDSNLTNIYQWIYNCYQPVLYNGVMMDMVRGRDIARFDETSQLDGQKTIAAVIRVADFAPSNDATAFRGMAKSWLQADTVENFIATTDLGTVPLAQAILTNSALASRGELIGHYTFGSMDRVVHLQPNYAFGLSMFSSRIGNYESINNENLHGWYTGYGMTYIYNSDQTQYDDSFWPTVNPYQLPGATVDMQNRSSSSGAAFRSSNNWVGGVTLNNWGAAGMQLNGWNSDLTARKSWFMFNDEIVCLGAGITCTSNQSVQTVVENRKLNYAATNAFTVNGTVEPDSVGWSGTLPGVSWAHLAGNTAGADIGYYFPQTASLKARRATSSGSWYAIDPYEVGSPTNLVARNYLTLWFDHGTNPVNGVYSYVLLPGKSAADMANYAALPKVSIIQNTAASQAVCQGPLGITAANFWNDGVQTANNITVNRKASVIAQITETNVVIAVADPTQTNMTGITVMLDQPVVQSVLLDPGVSIGQLSPALQITAATLGAAGKTFHATFAYHLTNFLGWQSVHFIPAQIADSTISGTMADPDHDGICNLMEYALLTDPWQANANTIQPNIIGGNFGFVYARRKLAADLLYFVDVSTNLLTWDTSGTEINQNIVSDNGSEQIVRVTEANASETYATRFFRVRVVYLQP